MEGNLFNRYKGLKFHTTPTLFPVDINLALEKRVCPICFCKLYEMRFKRFWYCKSKKHKKRFIISHDKLFKKKDGFPKPSLQSNKQLDKKDKDVIG